MFCVGRTDRASFTEIVELIKLNMREEDLRDHDQLVNDYVQKNEILVKDNISSLDSMLSSL